MNVTIFRLFLLFLTLFSLGEAIAENLYVVMLRPPRTRHQNPIDMRSDPFWHCGSFGLTGCHGDNLLHANNLKNLVGNRIAFIQGGRGDHYPIKLIFITPPLTVAIHHFINEVRWDPTLDIPFNYQDAPLFIDQDGNSDFPLVKNMLTDVNRGTWKGKVGSKFRTFSKPLEPKIASQILLT